MEAKNIRFESKYVVTFDIECLTGLHIGGLDTGGRIGELDNPVIKDAMTGLPMIAGSSLKGRIRERLEWNHIDSHHNNTAIERQLRLDDKDQLNIGKIGQCNCGNCDICHYFGHSKHDEDDPTKIFLGPTRILVRDVFPKEGQIDKWVEKLGTQTYTEVKAENTISRLTAIANPRQMERVPAGSIFSGEIVIDIYKIDYSEKEVQREQDDIKKALMLLFKGMMLIEDSFLGGGGSRGSGVVQFKSFQIKKYPNSYYSNPEEKEMFYDFKDKPNAKEMFKSKAYETVA